MRRGFTLIEMLVVVAIVVLLAGLLLPMVVRSYRVAERTRLRADLNTVATALDAYRADFGDYPRPTDNVDSRGAVILARALVALGPATLDGADGPGFRIRSMGKVHGPYLQQYKLGFLDGVNTSFDKACLLDKNGQPILYYPQQKLNLAISGTRYAWIRPPTTPPTEPPQMWNQFDNLGTTTTPRLFADINKFRVMMGDTSLDGVIQAGEQAIEQPFILWSSGPDEMYGPQVDPLTRSIYDRTADVKRCDDVTNFQ
jgi:prepilin-type N-terminal cleavage/methylation domain-containing protein